MKVRETSTNSLITINGNGVKQYTDKMKKEEGIEDTVSEHL